MEAGFRPRRIAKFCPPINLHQQSRAFSTDTRRVSPDYAVGAIAELGGAGFPQFKRRAAYGSPRSEIPTMGPSLARVRETRSLSSQVTAKIRVDARLCPQSWLRVRLSFKGSGRRCSLRYPAKQLSNVRCTFGWVASFEGRARLRSTADDGSRRGVLARPGAFCLAE